ncbi:MAG: sensor histidine kinase [Oscillospiraceae bacterium]
MLFLRNRQMKRELRGMAEAVGEIRTGRTNRQLTVGVQQKELAQLAAAINTLYEEVDTEKAAHRTAMDEMRASMANISHDLRTPLTSILGYLRLLERDGNTPGQREEYMGIITQKAELLNRLVGDLFVLTRLESGGHTFDFQRIDLVSLLGEELAGAYTLFSDKGMLPEVVLSDKPMWVVGDPGAFSRVFSNLLYNMAKHGREPLSVSCSETDGKAVLHFSNSAPNLTEKDVSQLFQRFFTADRMRSGESTGLGLSIVKEFTEQMNGSIEAELVDGILTFTLCWPLIQ